MQQSGILQPHLLIDLENTYVRASGGKRFANYLIDILCFYIFLAGIYIVWYLLSPESADKFTEVNSNRFADSIVTIVLYANFMFAQESIFKGRSIGKFITGTKAINIDGTPITKRIALLRGLSRAIPFAALSALGSPSNPWQDKWTDTIVIDLKKSTNLDL